MKTLKKRVDTAQARVAYWLNNDVFHHNGPKAELREYLGWASGDLGLLTEHVRGKTKEGVPLFPVKESDGIGAVERCDDPALQLSIGWLRQFDARQNSTQEGGSGFPHTYGAQIRSPCMDQCIFTCSSWLFQPAATCWLSFGKQRALQRM